MSLSNAVKAGALLFAGSVQFGIALIIAEVLYPNYDMSRTPISDLGATCNPSCTVFQPSSNIFNGSLVIFGLLTLLGAYFAMKAFHWRPLVAVLLVSGIGVAGAGLFTETTLPIHLVFSFLAFLFSALAAILSSRVLNSPLRYFSVILGVFALFAIALSVSGVYFGLGHGGMEKMIVYPALLWYVGFGGHLMAGNDAHRHPNQGW